MCGVVRWVDFDRSLAGERASILAMTATMTLRGPDAEGVWTTRSLRFPPNSGQGFKQLSLFLSGSAHTGRG